MGCRKYTPAFVFVFLLALTSPAQNPAQDPDGLTHPFESRADLEAFLRTAEIVKEQGTPAGITNPRRLTLDDGERKCGAIFKSIDDRRRGITRLEKSTEFDFKDSWKFEVAAYEIDKLLSLGMVPVTVERTYRGTMGSLQFWVEGCISEAERLEKKMEPPRTVFWNWEIYKIRIFDQLIYNIDRNLGNLLLTPDWKLVAIDHSRTFKSVDFLRAPEELEYFSRSLMEALKKVDEAALREKCGEYLTTPEISTTLKRRDRILKLYQEVLKEKGASATYP